MVFDITAELDPVPEASSRARTVLIIDDDEAQASSLSFALQRLGYETLTAARGQEGLRLARAERPDVLLLDLQLPDIDGLDICQQLADDPDTSGIGIIVISGSNHHSAVRRARAAGCEFYLRKPYDPNVVLTLVERVFDQREF
jgi:CheY-like chemotaxis protein